MRSPPNPEISAPPAVAAADRLACAVGVGEGGERLDRFLSQTAAARGLALSRTRLKALIEAGQVTIDGAEARDPAARVADGEQIALAVPPAEDAAIVGEDVPLTLCSRTNICSSSTNRPGSSSIPRPAMPPERWSTR